jgi:hypothetical protein
MEDENQVPTGDEQGVVSQRKVMDRGRHDSRAHFLQDVEFLQSTVVLLDNSAEVSLPSGFPVARLEITTLP